MKGTRIVIIATREANNTLIQKRLAVLTSRWPPDAESFLVRDDFTVQVVPFQIEAVDNVQRRQVKPQGIALIHADHGRLVGILPGLDRDLSENRISGSGPAQLGSDVAA